MISKQCSTALNLTRFTDIEATSTGLLVYSDMYLYRKYKYSIHGFSCKGQEPLSKLETNHRSTQDIEKKNTPDKCVCYYSFLLRSHILIIQILPRNHFDDNNYNCIDIYTKQTQHRAASIEIGILVNVMKQR